MNVRKFKDLEIILVLLFLFFLVGSGSSALASDDSKHRLLGADQNRDGIRDDVEVEIDAKFTGEIKRQTRQMAVKYQLILSGALSNQEISEHKAEIEYLDSCIRGATEDTNVGNAFLLPVQMNTVARIRTYFKVSADAYDEVGPPDSKSCDAVKDSSNSYD